MAKWASTCPDCGSEVGGYHKLGCPRAHVSLGGYAVAPTTEGRKDDVGKARHDLIPPELPEAIAAVLTFGASKYGERNWEKGMSWGRPYAALMRHMWAWWRGEQVDTETGMSHLWHACACITFLIAFEQRGKGIDDRP